MSDQRRSLELEVEIPGSPEEVWRAIATGPGISSWYVPHTVEERYGGAATASFGPEPEMQIEGRVAAWDPPRRVVFDGGEGVEGLAFEWTIEALDGGTCVVRLLNSGFDSGKEWDALYEGMSEGWQLFLLNLRLHMEHFRGRTATASLPTAMWSGTRDEALDCTRRRSGHPAGARSGRANRGDGVRRARLGRHRRGCRPVPCRPPARPAVARHRIRVGRKTRRRGRRVSLVLPLRGRRAERGGARRAPPCSSVARMARRAGTAGRV